MKIKNTAFESTFREQQSELQDSSSLESVFHLILLDDNEHSYHYVIEMLGFIFGYGEEKKKIILDNLCIELNFKT